MDSSFEERALMDSNLYFNIIQCRNIFTEVSWVEYSIHANKILDFIQPDRAMKYWDKDYAAMQESLFYGETEPFEELMNKLGSLKYGMNKMEGE